MKGTIIRSVIGRQVYSGRGHPGIEATVVTENGKYASAICTAGVSVGTHEIPFKYDGGEKFEGKGTSEAAKLIDEKIAPAIIGMDSVDQQAVDQVMLNIGKEVLGGNATAAVSAAVLQAAAKAADIPLYRHIGGVRAVTLPVAGRGILYGKRRYNEGPETNKPTYSFLAYDFATFTEASYALFELGREWDRIAETRFGIVGNNLLGFSDIPLGATKNDEEIWKIASDIIAQRGYEGRVGLQVDVASDSYYNHKTEIYEGLFNSDKRDRDEQIGFLIDMAEKYPFVVFEDPLYEDDYEGTAILTEKVDIQIVGDDLFTTDPKRVKEGIKHSAANCVLLKVNQIGTISESMDMIQLAQENGYGIMPCMSRGEGVEIADYCVGIAAGTVRECGTGEIGNRFIEIERELGSRARFVGKSGIKGRRFSPKNDIAR